MKMTVLALGGLAVAWVAAPVVALATRGTIDQRTRAAWRASVTGAAASTAPVIPAPRSGELDDRVSA